MKPSELAQNFMIAIAMCADENNLSTHKEVNRFEDELHDAVDNGLEAAHERVERAAAEEDEGE